MSENARTMLLKLVEEKYGVLIRKVAYEITGDWDVVEDVQQEVFLNYIRKFETLGKLSLDEIRNYICTAAKNMAINLRKRRNDEAEAVRTFYEQTLTMDSIDLKAFADKYGYGLEIQELLSCLDNTDKDIICLKYGEGFSDEEVAAAVCKSVDAVRKRNYRARVKLQNILLDRNEDD